MDYVVLDTDVSSLSLKRRLPSPIMTRLVGKQPCISFVTLGELTQWAELRQWGRSRREALNAWLAGVLVLPYDDDVAVIWGQISAAATRRGRPRPVNDTWVAACALSHDLPLATLNVKDFTDFATHEELTLITP